MSDIEGPPSFPIFVRGINDRGPLYVLESHDDVELSLEYPDVVNGEFEAWDSVGHTLSLEAMDSREGRGWLRITIDATEPPRDEAFLAGIIREYGRAHGLGIERAAGESLQDYAARTDSAVGDRLWNERPWWRRVLGLPNSIR